jgi:hypothetical protein
MKWKYDIRLLKRSRFETDFTKEVGGLNEAGEKGWEAVGFQNAGMFFKRPLD